MSFALIFELKNKKKLEPTSIALPAASTASIFSDDERGRRLWEVRPVLVLDQSDWPAADGSSDR